MYGDLGLAMGPGENGEAYAGLIPLASLAALGEKLGPPGVIPEPNVAAGE